MLINKTMSETVLLLLEEKQNIWDNSSACCKTPSWRFSFLEKAILPLELVWVCLLGKCAFFTYLIISHLGHFGQNSIIGLPLCLSWRGFISCGKAARCSPAHLYTSKWKHIKRSRHLSVSGSKRTAHLASPSWKEETWCEVISFGHSSILFFFFPVLPGDRDRKATSCQVAPSHL